MYGTVRTVVWEDGGREPASYPILKYFISKKMLVFCYYHFLTTINALQKKYAMNLSCKTSLAAFICIYLNCLSGKFDFFIKTQ